MHRTVEERVRRGIQWLDSRTRQHGKHQPVVPTNWRSRLNIDGLMFANPEKGPIGQLFGDYRNGMYKMRTYGGADFGYRSRFAVADDPAKLKAAWKHALRTDKTWNKLGDCVTRVIKGVRFTLTTSSDGTVKVTNSKNGTWAASYCSYDSAKRSLRRRFNDI